jgi:hypothetical protein
MISTPKDINRIEQEQKIACRRYSAAFVSSPSESKLGFALSTKGRLPINGLRHYPQGDTNGWYLWCGEHYSESAEFFQPLHTCHVYEQYANLTRLLGLAPGYRFLLAGDYLDVWYDPSLLNPSKYKI